MLSNSATSSSSFDGPTLIVNPNDPANPILSINMKSITRLTTSNYITWSLQVSLFPDGLNLKQFISDDGIIPPATIQVDNNPAPNPAHTAWIRQDKLIFSALLGSISTSQQTLVTTATTSRDAWIILKSNFGRASRGHILQIKDKLKKAKKEQKLIDEYLQSMKAKANQLALLGKPLDHEDIIEYILDGLDDEYMGIVEQINGLDVRLSLDELRDKLVNKEAAIVYSAPSTGLPVTANVATTTKPKPALTAYQQTIHDTNAARPSSNCRFSKPYLG